MKYLYLKLFETLLLQYETLYQKEGHMFEIFEMCYLNIDNNKK